MTFLFPVIFTLGYWLLFFLLVTVPSRAYLILFVLVGLFIGITVLTGVRSWLQIRAAWVNTLIFLLSSYFFVLILTSQAVRNAYILIFGALSGLLIYIHLITLRSIRQYYTRAYQELAQSFYFVAYWQAASVLYFAIISYDVSVWHGLAILAPITLLIGGSIISAHGLRRSSLAIVSMVLLLTIVELFIFLEYLPLHYFVLSAMLTLWFFFLIQMVIAGQDVTSRRRLFRIYASGISAAIALLLLTANWA